MTEKAVAGPATNYHRHQIWEAWRFTNKMRRSDFSVQIQVSV
jgi:hypothetical protein